MKIKILVPIIQFQIYEKPCPYARLFRNVQDKDIWIRYRPNWWNMCSFYLSDYSLQQKQTSKEISAEIWTNSKGKPTNA